MPRPRKKPNAPVTRADFEAFRDHLDKPLTPPRPWLKDCQRDQRLREALLRNVERNILFR
jgi:hypothetical protein